MSKPEALVDTCFLHKFSKEGKNPELLKKILENLEFSPVVHPYIWEHELEMSSYIEKLRQTEMLRIASYDEFLKDQDDRELYTEHFHVLYKGLDEYYKATKAKKRVEKIPEKCDIFKYRKAKTSIGDVHVVLMASYANIPVIFSNDGDIPALKSIAKRKIDSESYQMTIYDALEAMEQIIKIPECAFSKKDIENILNEIGERSQRSRFKKLWDAYHGPSIEDNVGI